MKRILFAGVLVLVSAAAPASREQCARLYADESSLLVCHGTYGQRHSWTDEEIRSAVDSKIQGAKDDERKESELKAKRERAKVKLAAESKIKALRLKGLYPGMTLAAADVFHPNLAEFCTDAAAPTADFTCNFHVSTQSRGKYEFESLETLADQRVAMWVFAGTKGVIWRISALIDPDAATELQLALATKYPYAKFSEPAVQNRTGAKFSNPTAVWMSGDLVLKVEKYGASLDSGHVQFTSTKAPRGAKPNTKDL